MTEKTLDLITIGRASVDLYGSQTGGRLEDMRSFDKYVGGSPANIAAGAARLGLRSALITRVGDEHMGRFVREQLAREGVDLRGVAVDPDRPTALVLLGIRDDDSFPMMFYRENCADMALAPGDVDECLIAEAKVVLFTGTHLSAPGPEAALARALDLAGRHGARRALDIDYRPSLWGLGNAGDGESRYVASAAVTMRIQAHLPQFDLVVGTEEEFHIAGGIADTHAALRAVRALTDAVLVCKRGPMGAVVVTGVVPDDLGDAIAGAGFAIEAFNVVGAGRRVLRGASQGMDPVRGLGDRADLGQCLRGARGVAPRMHTGLSVGRRARALPSPRGRHACPAPRCRTRAGALVDEPPRHMGSGADLRLRPPRSDRGHGGVHVRQGRGFQEALSRRGAAGAGGTRGIRHPVRRTNRARGAARGGGHGPLGRTAVRMARIKAPGAGAAAGDPTRAASKNGLRARSQRCCASAIRTTHRNWLRTRKRPSPASSRPRGATGSRRCSR